MLVAGFAACVGPVFAAASPRAEESDAAKAGAGTGTETGAERVIRTGLATVRGPLSFSAARASIWTETQTAAGAQVQRIFLAGDVKIQMGSYEFYAARAAVWLERLDDSPLKNKDGSTRAGVYQVYIYFDRVGNPRASASVSLAADRLPVRGVLDVDGAIGLRFDAATSSRPVDVFLDEAELVYNESARRLATGETPLEDTPIPYEAERPFRQPTRVDPLMSKPYRNVREINFGEASNDLERQMARLPFGEENAPIFAKQGVITVAAGNVVYQGHGKDSPTPAAVPTADGSAPATDSLMTPTEGGAVIASDGVIIQYVDPRTNRGLQLQAQRAVIFLAAKADASGGVRTNFAVGDVEGVYLEGDVLASDGKYTLRGPKIFYNVALNKAILLDAVFWSYDEDRALPLYLRADVIRQESQTEFSGTRARFSTSAFFEPEFSLGAQTVTIRRKQVSRDTMTGASAQPTRAGLIMRGGISDDLSGNPGGRGSAMRTVTMVEATDITLNAEGLPIFYVPNYEGDPETVLLKDVRVENSSGNGPAVKTRWNLAPVLGYGESENTKIDFLAQYYFDRGVGLGIDAAYKDEDSEGSVYAYGIVNDSGQDLLKPGTHREWDDATRGIILAEQKIQLTDHWKLFAEGSYVGDETFIDAFLEPLGETRREFTSQVDLSRNEENTGFFLRAKTSLNDFIANEYLLQSKGYSVQKAPEIGYVRQMDLLFEDLGFGEIFWTQEYRLSNMSMQFDEVYARERGFDRPDLSQRAFGIGPDDRISDSLRTLGYQEDSVNRLDTRHEFSSPQKLGPVDVTPFVVARATAYDTDFTTFSPQETDNTRLWGSAGVRAATQMQRIDDSVRSDFFDLNRIRHIVEPNVTVWTSGTNVDHKDLPIYDEDVENLAEGTMAKIGVDQVWQTKRGDPLGKGHTADVFKLDTAVVLSTGDVDPKNPFGRWLDFRPELSNPGNYITMDGAWQVSSALAITGNTVYDLDTRQQDRTAGGFLIQHNPRYSSFAELRYLNPLDSTFLDLGTSYQLTSRYRFTGIGSYDITNGGFQGAGGELSRSNDAFLVALRLSYNNTTDATSFGFVVKPSLTSKKKRTKILDEEADSSNEVTTESLR